MRDKTKPKRRPCDTWKKPRDQWKRYTRPGNGLLQTEAEIAAALGEEPRTVRTWRCEGIIPAIVLGRKTVRFNLDAVLKALAKRTVREVA